MNQFLWNVQKFFTSCQYDIVSINYHDKNYVGLFTIIEIVEQKVIFTNKKLNILQNEGLYCFECYCLEIVKNTLSGFPGGASSASPRGDNLICVP